MKPIDVTPLLHGMSREQLLEKMQQRLDTNRFEHCLRVEQTAAELAKRFDQDVMRASLAGLLHDYAKQVPVTDYVDTIKTQGFDQDLLKYGRGVWHGMVGTWYIQHELGVDDPLVLQAINRHTTGDPAMGLLDQIIFVADFIEPKRELAVEEKAREAAQTSLEAATLIELTSTLTYLISNQKVVYPTTLLTYNAFIEKENR